MDALMQQRRPPPQVRQKLDLGFRVTGQSVEIFEIRPAWRGPADVKHESAVAKATFVRTRGGLLCDGAATGRRPVVVRQCLLAVDIDAQPELIHVGQPTCPGRRTGRVRLLEEFQCGRVVFRSATSQQVRTGQQLLTVGASLVRNSCLGDASSSGLEMPEPTMIGRLAATAIRETY